MVHMFWMVNTRMIEAHLHVRLNIGEGSHLRCQGWFAHNVRVVCVPQTVRSTLIKEKYKYKYKNTKDTKIQQQQKYKKKKLGTFPGSSRNVYS